MGFATLNRDHFWRHRLFSLIQQVFLVAAFVLMGSVPGLFNTITVMISNVIGMGRKLREQRSGGAVA
jgi:hypothetical protein